MKQFERVKFKRSVSPKMLDDIGIPIEYLTQTGTVTGDGTWVQVMFDRDQLSWMIPIKYLDSMEIVYDVRDAIEQGYTTEYIYSLMEQWRDKTT